MGIRKEELGLLNLKLEVVFLDFKNYGLSVNIIL